MGSKFLFQKVKFINFKFHFWASLSARFFVVDIVIWEVDATSDFVLLIFHLFFLDSRLPQSLLPIVLGLVLGNDLVGETLVELAAIP